MTVTEWARARLLAHGWTLDANGGQARRNCCRWLPLHEALDADIEAELRAAAREEE